MKASQAVLVVIILSCLICSVLGQRRSSRRGKKEREGKQQGKTTVVSCRVFRRGVCRKTSKNVILMNKSISIPAKCQLLCYATPGCAAFTQIDKSKTEESMCILFRDCNGKLGDCRNCISGPIMPRVTECLAARQEEAPEEVTPAPGFETLPETDFDVDEYTDVVIDEDYQDEETDLYEDYDDSPDYYDDVDVVSVEETTSSSNPEIDYDFQYLDEEDINEDIPLDEKAIEEPEEEIEEIDVNIDEGFLNDSQGRAVDLPSPAHVKTVVPGQGVTPLGGNTFVFFFCVLGGANNQGAVNVVDLLNTGLGNAAQSLSIAPLPSQVIRGGRTSSVFTGETITTCSQGFTILSPYGFIYKPGSCYDYSLISNNWVDTGARLTSFRRGATITKLGRYMMATGGYRQKRSLNTVEVFDPKRPKAGWRKLSKLQMPVSVSEHCAVTLPGRSGKEVIITGGKGRGNRVMKLDVRTQKWYSLNRMTDGRRKHACVKASINGRPGMIVSGGSSAKEGANLTSVEFYDAKTGQWFKMPNLQRGRQGHAMMVTEGKLVVAGGESLARGGRQYLDDMEVFTGTRWVTSKQKLDRPRSGFSLIKIPKERNSRTLKTSGSSRSHKTSRRSKTSGRSKSSKRSMSSRSPKSSDGRRGSQNSRG